jgi:hypothetical protein
LLSNGQLPETYADIAQKEAVAIRAHVEKLLDNGDDVLMVMHSYAGVPGTESLEGFGKKERQAEERQSGVVGLVYMCAFMLWEGARILEDLILANEHYRGELRYSTTVSKTQKVHGAREKDFPNLLTGRWMATLFERYGLLLPGCAERSS